MNSSEFKPSTHGLKFINRFPGYPLPFKSKGLPRASKIIYGLCGGMCFTVLDVINSEGALPQTNQIPEQGTRLQRYLFRRQMNSWGILLSVVARVAIWAFRRDEGKRGTQHRTWQYYQQLQQKLDTGAYEVLCLIYVDARESFKLSDNHQVLAYAITQVKDGVTDIQVYDPNHPCNDSITLRAYELQKEEGPPELAVVHMVDGEPYKKVRGFFPMRYRQVTPPES